MSELHWSFALLLDLGTPYAFGLALQACILPCCRDEQAAAVEGLLNGHKADYER